MNISLLTLIISSLFLSSYAATYYVNESSTATPITGNQTNPFISIATAYTTLGAKTIELVLLGSSASFGNTLTFSTNSNYTIRPDSTNSQFIIYLKTGAVIKQTGANVTFQNVQFIELNPARSTSSPAFQPASNTNLTFQNVTVRDVYPTAAAYYIFIKAGTKSVVSIINCRFENNTNLEMIFSASPAIVTGSVFKDLTNTATPLFLLGSMTTQNVTGLTFQGNVFKNIVVGSLTSSGFISNFISHTSIIFQDFYINNVTFQGESPFIYIGNSGTTYQDTPSWTTSVTIANGVIKNMYEKNPNPVANVASYTLSYFLNCQGPTILKFYNTTADNIIFKNLNFLSWTVPTSTVLNTWTVLPSADINGLTIRNGSNVNMIFWYMDTINYSNIYLENLSIEGVYLNYTIFNFMAGHSFTANNITANNIYGPVFNFQDVMAQNFTNCNFNNMTSSQNIDLERQSITIIYKISDPYKKGLDPTRTQFLIFDNFNLNGFYDPNRMNYSADANNTYFITAHVIYGKVYIQNSRWYNNFMSSYLSGHLRSLTVDNLTIETDPTFPTEKMPQHRGFMFVNALEVIMKNSLFQNNQNFLVFNFDNFPRNPFYYQIVESYLTLENLTTINNTGNLKNPVSVMFSQFIFYSPMKPFNALINNCYFYNNTNLNGLINALENYQAKMTITNNIFDNNYAIQSGGVFNSRSMRQKTSTLNLTNNTFTNNGCAQNGGVYSFILTDYQMSSVNNIYINNSAGLAGGVGYGLRASFALLEENAYYENNAAGTYGGTWYLSANNYKTNLQSFLLSQNTFINSTAQQKGGCIYLETGSISLDQCIVQNSKAVEAGGDIYISIGKTIKITNSQFSESYANQGSFLYAEEIDGLLSISGSQITDIASSNPDAFLLTTSAGSLSITDTFIENISSPLFLISDATTVIQNLTVSQISCSKSSNSFCLLKAMATDSVQIINSSFTEVSSNVDIISLSNCTDVILSNISAQNFLKINTQSFLPSEQIYTLNALKVVNLSIEDSEFTKIGFSGLKVKNSALNLQNSHFSNNLKGDRLLAQSFDDSIYYALSSQPIQFLILDTSSSSLTNVIFNQNSLNTLANGGAIQILGQGGSHTITDSTFENNQASNGGAIYVQDQADSIQIVNSQFANNQVTGDGGALIFPDNSVKNSLTMTQATFLQNIATLGGAVYLGNQALTVDSSSFIENSALQGGAIATKTSSASTMVQLTQSTFTGNSASQGASLVSLGAMNYEYSTSTFIGNTAKYGGDLTSVPSSIRLRIFYFDPYFLYFDNINVNDIFARPSTSLIYDSTTASPSQSIAFTSGSNPNLLFEITILDAFGDKIGLAENAYGEFYVKSYSPSSSANLVGMLGNGKFIYTDSTAYVFNAFSVKGAFETNVALAIKGVYLSQSTNTVESFPVLILPVILSKCSIGQIYDKSTSICTSCSSKTFSFSDPFTTKTCLQCLDNAVCIGGSLMYPVEGYWRINEASENLVQCPQSQSCLGGSKDGGKNISLTGFCAEGYEGVACSSCAPGYAKFGSNQSCIDCKKSKLYYVMFGGYLIIQAIAVISTVRMNIKGSKLAASSKKSAILQSTLMKIVIDFVQIVTLASEFNFNFPEVVGYLLDGVSKIIPTNIDALSVDCFIALNKGSNKHIFFNKVLVLLFEPFAYMIFAYIAWVLLFKIKKRTIFRNPDFKYKMALTCIVIIYILQPGIIKIMFELFNCKNYGSSADPKYYLVYDVQVECWKPEHLSWALCIGVPTIIFGLLIPFTILARWSRDKDLLTASKVQKQYSFIFKSYKKNAIFWEIAILIRKVILILISVFITSQYLQAYLGFLLLILYFKFSFKISPYNAPQLNLAEALSLASSALILYTGLYFARADEMDTVAYMLFAVDIISGIIFVLYCIYIFWSIFKNSDLKRKLTSIGSKVISDKLYNNLRLAIHKQQTLTQEIQTPISIQSDEPNSATGQDLPLTSDRCLSSERPLRTLHVKSAFALPVLPDLGDRTNSRDVNGSSERKEESYTELPINSPAHLSGLELVNWKRSAMMSPFQEVDTPVGKVESGDFSEILEGNMAMSPVQSPDNKLSKVLKFSKENWADIMTKRNSTPDNEKEDN